MQTLLDHHDKTPRRGAKLLRRWAKRSGLSKQDAAAALGLSPQEFSRFAHDAQIPGMMRAARIAVRTAGAVPVGSWLIPAVKR